MSAPTLLTIRPEPGLSATLARARDAELAMTGHPLFAAQPLAWQAPDAGRVDGLLLGSANAVRCAGTELAAVARLPAYCVGAETAKVAADVGITVCKVGTGNLQDLLDSLAGERLHLLRLAGEVHTPVRPPVNIEITTRHVYAMDALPLPSALATRLKKGAIVLLHSGEAAAHFAAECDRHGVSRDAVGLAALAPRIAGRAGTGWRRCAAATVPEDAALLAVAARMCKEWR